MIEEKYIREIVEAYIAESSYFLVEVKVDKNNCITVAIDSNEDVSIDYCAELSRHIESKLDRDGEDFEFEVGSAGLTSPLVVLQQYRKYEGNNVEVQVANGPKYTGKLVNVTEADFGLEVTKKVKKEGEKKKVEVTEVMTFSYDQVKYTKYLITFK
ncbi:MAG: ribosome assembly cofactor RimP [Paludibacteraceae bacterium]|nr:ribosome assembly cofactor RimP [Paludibacteraceae bacterium]